MAATKLTRADLDALAQYRFVPVVVTIAGRSGRGFRIPRRPGHTGPRAGYVGDYRSLAERLSDPSTPKDVDA